MKSFDSEVVDLGGDPEAALAKIGLDKKMVKRIAHAASAARAESSPLDPKSAPGLLSYIYGVREIREQLLINGWRQSNVGNVEATVNDELGVQLLFQNVDEACNPDRVPQPVSGKGPASRQLVHAGQGDLFNEPVVGDNDRKHGQSPVVWIVCVAASEESVQVEVSCPKIFYGPMFEEFHQRIFVLSDDAPKPKYRTNNENDAFDDLDVVVSKK